MVKHSKVTIFEGYLTGDCECGCLAKEVTKDGIADDPIRRYFLKEDKLRSKRPLMKENINGFRKAYKERDKSLIYFDDLFPDEIQEEHRRTKKKYRFKITVEVEDI